LKKNWAYKDPWAAHKFEPLDIPRYLLERFQRSPLLTFPPRTIPEEAGIYALYLEDRVVYIGKATRNSHLRKRIWQSANTIRDRKIKLSQFGCRFLLMPVEWVDYAEHHLIYHYQPAWNGSESESPIRGALRLGVKGPPNWDEMYPLAGREKKRQ
jgi:hypothetical protein